VHKHIIEEKMDWNEDNSNDEEEEGLKLPSIHGDDDDEQE
jgi:hypothetical protein